MKRTLEVEFETKAKKTSTAIERFFKKYPSLNYWKETFEYMAENNKDFECDNLLADGTKNKDWSFALHLDINEDSYYFCIIERA
jgi:hypothetical protein